MKVTMSWIESFYRLVDKIYSPAEGLKTSPSKAIRTIDYLITCNQPSLVAEDKVNTLVNKRLMTTSECWDILVYLHQSRKEIIKKGADQFSCFSNMIKPLDEIDVLLTNV